MQHLYENVLEPSVLEQLQRIHTTLIQKHGETQQSRSTRIGVNYDILFNTLDPIVKSIIGDYAVHDSYFQRDRSPASIHTDLYNTNNKQTYMSVLFPLGSDGPTSTVIFAEQSTDVTTGQSNTEAKKLFEQLPTSSYEYTNTECRLLAHCDSFMLSKLSSPKFFDWKPGHVLVWPRVQIHASDDMAFHNTTYKDSLILFTTQP